MATQTPASFYSSDVLHAEHQHKLSDEEIAKAVARHQREHPVRCGTNAAAKPQKTMPRH